MNNNMKAEDIYHQMRRIAEEHHAYADQLTAIAKWIEAEFEYKPKKSVNIVNKTNRDYCRTCKGTGLVYIDDIIKNTLCPDC